ncbi:hypothetical protein CANCADRAFT_79 [Tortispora caseinolytica NRRL Y-17796]|uniref:Anaphase-promoting complex subunit 4 WD40 domain-containing protein n=1 Tax=Tortispora caseinolytica NRRL Y-17796 TaxID=767744 RepID=A0A1E4TIF2_9ASCO|nr:hypothetical protein CANCADRAFT_79 [Tortispora caseinolytica NRRL Y-17796]
MTNNNIKSFNIKTNISNFHCMEWISDDLICGHDNGVTVYRKQTDFQPTFIPLSQPAIHIAASRNQRYLAVSHPDCTISLIDFDTSSDQIEPVILESRSAHHSHIQSLAVSKHGIVASTSSDGILAIWTKDQTPRTISLNRTGNFLKFVGSPTLGKSDDRLLMLLNENAIRIIDLEQLQFIFNVYPFPPKQSYYGHKDPQIDIIDISLDPSGTKLLALTKTNLLIWTLAELTGGCAYTEPHLIADLWDKETVNTKNAVFQARFSAFGDCFIALFHTGTLTHIQLAHTSDVLQNARILPPIKTLYPHMPTVKDDGSMLTLFCNNELIMVSTTSG